MAAFLGRPDPDPQHLRAQRPVKVHRFKLARVGRRLRRALFALLEGYPLGATEFVDVHLDAARSASARYAVMVVNAYSGMAFSQLERAFAGYMVRGDTGGQHFDARTVEMRFDLQGEKGIFVPVGGGSSRVIAASPEADGLMRAGPGFGIRPITVLILSRILQYEPMR